MTIINTIRQYAYAKKKLIHKCDRYGIHRSPDTIELTIEGYFALLRKSVSRSYLHTSNTITEEIIWLVHMETSSKYHT